jgi:Arc/MetJ family transcription regulator
VTARQAYVNTVVRHYVRLPGTPLSPSRRDRQLAGTLYDRRIPLSVVWSAFVIAAVRRAVRSAGQRRLETIRTLYYFLPAIDEVLETSPDPDYVQYLAAKLRPFVAEKDRLLEVVR